MCSQIIVQKNIYRVTLNNCITIIQSSYIALLMIYPIQSAHFFSMQKTGLDVDNFILNTKSRRRREMLTFPKVCLHHISFHGEN